MSRRNGRGLPQYPQRPPRRAPEGGGLRNGQPGYRRGAARAPDVKGIVVDLDALTPEVNGVVAALLAALHKPDVVPVFERMSADISEAVNGLARKYDTIESGNGDTTLAFTLALGAAAEYGMQSVARTPEGYATLRKISERMGAQLKEQYAREQQHAPFDREDT